MAAAAEEQKDNEALFTLAPLPEIKRGYGYNMYASKHDMFAYGNGKTVVVRSLADPSKSTLFHEHKANVNVAAFSPNGEWMASGDDEGKVIVWAVNTGVVKIEVPCCSSVSDIAWDADGKRICAVGNGRPNMAKVFMWDSGSNLGKIEGHNKPILSVSYRKTRPYRIATCSEDLSVRFYQGPPFKFDKSFKDHQRYPNRVRYSPNGEVFMSVGADMKLFVFDGKTGDKLREIENTKETGHKGAIYGFDWSPDGKQFITASSDKTAKIWDYESGNVLQTIEIGKDVGDMQMACLWHKEWCLTVSLTGVIRYINPADGSITRTVDGHKSTINDLCVDVKNGVFYTGDTDGNVCKWDRATGAATRFTGKGHGKAIKGCRVTADGANLVTVGQDDKIRVNPVAGMEFAKDGEKLGGLPNRLVCGNADAGLAVVALAQEKLVVCRDGKVASTLELKYAPLCLSLSSDDSVLVVGGKNKKVYVYALAGDALKETESFANGHGRAVTAVAWTPKQISSASGDRNIYHWEGGAIKNVAGWPFHSATINWMDYNPDFSRLVTSAQDESFIVWSDLDKYDQSKRVAIQPAHKAGVTHVAWWDATSIVSAGADRSVKIWQVAA